MHIINKLVGFFMNPLMVAAVLGIVAFVCYRLGRCRVAKWLGIAAVAWLWVWSIPLTVRIVGASLEREFLVDGRVPAVESFPSADAIVLLGGSMSVETNLSSYAEMSLSADRVRHAARLWKAGRGPRIIATGDYAKDSTLPLLKELGVEEASVLFVDARNTEEEAKSVMKMLERSGGVGELGVEESNSSNHPLKNSSTSKAKVLLVTSAWHMKRARLMFRKYAPEVEVVCAPADFENSMMAARPFSPLEFFPDHNAFLLNYLALHEWVGLMGYKLLR